MIRSFLSFTFSVDRINHVNCSVTKTYMRNHYVYNILVDVVVFAHVHLPVQFALRSLRVCFLDKSEIHSLAK